MKQFFEICVVFGSLALATELAYVVCKMAWESYCDYKYEKRINAYLARKRRELKKLSDEYNVVTDETFDLGIVDIDKLRFGDEE